MNFIYELIAVFEIILMNMYIFKKNVKPLYPRSIVFTVLFFYTILLYVIVYQFIQALGIYGNGNGLFTLFGFCYLFPLRYLFEGSTRKHFYIICFAWIYTLSVFVISVQVGYVVDADKFALVTMISETILFSATYSIISKFLKKIYLRLMQDQDPSIQKYLNFTSLFWFITILLINLHFIFYENRILKITAILCLVVNSYYNYLLIYEMLIRRNLIGRLEHKVANDMLTGLSSRMEFDRVMKLKIQQQQPFYLIYMDLNEFKSVNDKYGHLIGDQYLQEFSKELLRLYPSEYIFRISGDEFVILYLDKNIDEIVDAIKQINFQLKENQVPFLGVSYGIAHYPNDRMEMDALISLADQRMYIDKQHRKQ